MVVWCNSSLLQADQGQLGGQDYLEAHVAKHTGAAASTFY